jgi:hypothetical protein
MGHQAAFIAYYVVAGVSAVCSVFVSATLCLYGSLKTTATQLLLLLHITLLLEEISSLPFVFNDVRGICTAVAFLHFYSGLANAVAVGLLVISYRYHFMEDTLGVTQFIEKYSNYLVGVLPLITLLPLTTGSYSNHNDVWCTMQTDSFLTNLWAFVIFYFWAWPILIFSTIVLYYTMHQVYSIDREIGFKLFSTTGMYAIVSILSWVPRTVARFSTFGRKLDNTSFLYAYFPVYIAGIIYTLVFIREKKALLLFDRLSDWTGESGGFTPEMSTSFSWETSGSGFKIDLARSRSNSSQNNERFGPKRGVYSALIPEQFLMEA